MGGRSSRQRTRLDGRWSHVRRVAGTVVVLATASAAFGLGPAEGGTGDPQTKPSAALAQDRVPNPIVDLTAGIPGKSPNIMLSRWARRDQEVVVQGEIPREAIRRVK